LTDGQRWHTSSYSANTGANCVEVAETPDTVRVRDSQNRELGHLSYPAAEWSAFLSAVRTGEV
jgi:hypothetical protein